jgi:3-oxoadipate enol-lactonase
MEYHTADSQTLYYETYGEPDGDPFLFLHGLGADHRMWVPQVESFSQIGYHLILPDLRAHGKSMKVNDLTLDDWVEDMVGLLDSLEIGAAHVVGVSMGGVIAQAFGVSHPERCMSLILSDTFCELATAGERMLGSTAVFGLRIFSLLGRKVFAKAMRSAYAGRFGDHAREYFTDMGMDADFGQLILARRAINTIDLRNSLAAVAVPALVIVGEANGKTFVEINRKIAESLPQARLETIPEAVDPSSMVRPDEWNRIVLEFLQSIRD